MKKKKIVFSIKPDGLRIGLTFILAFIALFDWIHHIVPGATWLPYNYF